MQSWSIKITEWTFLSVIDEEADNKYDESEPEDINKKHEGLLSVTCIKEITKCPEKINGGNNAMKKAPKSQCRT
jgi:hypothetical protein